ncbi:hypothetical protein PF003_g13809 [Phytophthora fragariae]|nr:hypothetical protein PF003_g13809 [Phytophthora fragariae]
MYLSHMGEFIRISLLRPDARVALGSIYTASFHTSKH